MWRIILDKKESSPIHLSIYKIKSLKICDAISIVEICTNYDYQNKLLKAYDFLQKGVENEVHKFTN
ncbi:hypothetical protein acsn021_22710 [Anaerocolumna cellulosilytica]|uniref:Uncharacterized protein n=1 Tax=Anaerocolumna cellulosilytica TaxID=433286 RepID=A0A6S6R5I3_9FIRM|nr:hypothetical protein acsn021_22710 [Anaerocolumna cellulosilytica]